MGTAVLSGRDFLQIRDAARLLGVSEQTLRNWDRMGALRAHRHPINGYRLFRVADLHAVLDKIK
jgi:DNA-binding transcriptional MerR regulator